MIPQERDPFYEAGVKLARAGAMVLMHPAGITRLDPDGTAFGGPYGRTIYHDGVVMRHSRALGYLEQLAIIEGQGWENEPVFDMRHAMIPLVWSWGFGLKTGLPEHPAGELRWLFIADPEGP